MGVKHKLLRVALAATAALSCSPAHAKVIEISISGTIHSKGDLNDIPITAWLQFEDPNYNGVFSGKFDLYYHGKMLIQAGPVWWNQYSDYRDGDPWYEGPNYENDPSDFLARPVLAFRNGRFAGVITKAYRGEDIQFEWFYGNKFYLHDYRGDGVSGDPRGNGSVVGYFDPASIRATVDGVPVAISAVPEPSTWAMLIAGFGIIGGALRIRRPRRRVAFA